jgi:hypothetical protein
LIDNGNVQLNIGTCVDGIFCMDDDKMLLENFFKWKCHGNIEIYIEILLRNEQLEEGAIGHYV